eukprot:gene5691-6275_t
MGIAVALNALAASTFLILFFLVFAGLCEKAEESWLPGLNYQIFPSSQELPCQKDEEIERLVHTKGTRTRIFIFYHDNRTSAIVHHFAQCKDWITPFRLEKSPFMESQVYRDLFLPSVASLTQEVDFVLTCTYRHVLKSVAADGHVTTTLTWKRLQLLLDRAVRERLDAIPIETVPRSFIISSLMSSHGIGAIKAWNVLLVRMGFSVAAVDSGQHIYGFWRSSYLIRPAVLQQLTKLMVEAMGIVERDEACKGYFKKNAKYMGDPIVAYTVFGTPYYQMHPFIFERLPAFFLAMMGASVPGLLGHRFRRPAQVRISTNNATAS